MPGRRAAADHPDHDLLADLAAQTLDPDLAARVAEHVEGCDQCGQLLADAEGITGALHSLPAEAMPADIGQRLERALAAERARPAAGEVLAGDAAAGGVAAGATAPGAPAAAPPTMPISTSAAASNVSSTRTGELPTRRSLRAANTGGVDTGSFPPAPDSAPSSPSTEPIGTTGGPATGPQTTYPLPEAAPELPGGPLTGSTRRIPIAGRGGAAGPATGSTGRVSEGAFARLTRPGGRDRPGARRQALEEQRSDQPSRVFPMLRVAAGVVLVLVVGAGVYKVVGGNSDNSGAASTAAGAAGGDAAALVLAPVLNTGTDYEKDTLESQIRQLVSTSQKTVATSSGALRSEAGSGDKQYSAEAANPAASPLAANTGSSGDLLKSDTALRACLTGLGEGDVQPVAVDLASYGGQDAAILVLPGPGGDYTVWVVGRDCTATQQTNIAQLNVPS